MEKHTVQALLAGNLTKILRQKKFPLHQLKALESYSKCRTAALGGNSQYCKNGHLNGVWYNSCRHRACPQCQSLASEQWLLDIKRILLDRPHHHIIFTMPSELNLLFKYNEAAMIDILFKASQTTLTEFSRDERHLNATLGMIASLHTWGRNLALHPHIHYLVTHGGLDNDGQWREPKRKSLFPAKAVMQVYRAKFLTCLRQEIKKDTWKMPPSISASYMKLLLNKIYQKAWVVHFCDRYNYADGVAKYLSRYVKSGPMRNNQLRASSLGFVRFAYKSHQTKRRESLNLKVVDFVQRLIQHVPPAGKRTIRRYGLYHPNACKKLMKAREGLSMTPLKPKEILTWQHFLNGLNQTPVCHVCGETIGPVSEDDALVASTVA